MQSLRWSNGSSRARPLIGSSPVCGLPETQVAKTKIFPPIGRLTVRVYCALTLLLPFTKGRETSKMRAVSSASKAGFGTLRQPLPPAMGQRSIVGPFAFLIHITCPYGFPFDPARQEPVFALLVIFGHCMLEPGCFLMSGPGLIGSD